MVYEVIAPDGDVDLVGSAIRRLHAGCHAEQACLAVASIELAQLQLIARTPEGVLLIGEVASRRTWCVWHDCGLREAGNCSRVDGLKAAGREAKEVSCVS